MGENNTSEERRLFEHKKVMAQAEVINKKFGVNRSVPVPSELNFDKEYNMLQEMKNKEARIKYENNEYLKKVSEDLSTIKVDIKTIANSMTAVNKQLQILNDILNEKELKLVDIKDEIDTENRLLADIYETLASLKIDDETSRIKSSGDLLSSFADATTLITNLTTIISIVSGNN